MLGGPLERSGFPPPSGGFTPSRCGLFLLRRSQFAGREMRHRIIAALETACRQGEQLKIKNHHLDWDRYQIQIPASNAKDDEPRRIPFEPDGRLARILEQRRFLGPQAFVFGKVSGAPLQSFRTAWESVLFIAHGLTPKTEREKSEALETIDPSLA